jgi:hypothetical protein
MHQAIFYIPREHAAQAIATHARMSCTYEEGDCESYLSCACEVCHYRAELQAESSRDAAEKAGFWPLGDGYYLACRSVENFDFAARIQAASSMIVFANSVVKLLPSRMFLQGTSAPMCAGLAYPLYEVPGSHMHASTLRRIRCVAGIARKLFPSDDFLWNDHRSLLVRRVLSSYYNRAQVRLPVCYVCCSCLFIPCASVLGQLYLFAAPAIILTGTCHCYRFFVPAELSAA